MNTESKFSKTVKHISNIGIFAVPILTFLYFLWLQNTQLFIFFKNYKIILFSCGSALWIGFVLTLTALTARKRIALGIILFLITAPCLSISSLLLIEDGPTVFNNLPSRLDVAQLGTNTYHLTSEKGEWSLHYLELYKCGNYNLHCEQLPFGSRDHNGGHIVRDISNSEINVVNDSGSLIYTYGDHPRYYDSDSRTQLKSRLYYLSEECDELSCNLFTYTLYECGLNNISCKQVQFKFKIKHEVYLYLESNKAVNEISVYNDYGNNKTLIYTYGSHPRCYVEGCEILKP